MLKNIIKINLYRNKVDNNPDIIKLKKKHNLSNSLPRTRHKLNIENFENNQKNLKTESDKIIDENHQFLTSYEMFLKKFPKNYEKEFKDLLEKYKQNGYKIPDLSMKHNLFKINPLLFNDRKINDFYTFFQNKNIILKIFNKLKKKKDKYLTYLKKEKKEVDERLLNFQKEKVKQLYQTEPNSNSTLKEAVELLVNNNINKIENKQENNNKINRTSIISNIIQQTIKKQFKKDMKELENYNNNILKIIPPSRNSYISTFNDYSDNSISYRTLNINKTITYNNNNSNKKNNIKKRTRNLILNNIDFNDSINISNLNDKKIVKNYHSENAIKKNIKMINLFNKYPNNVNNLNYIKKNNNNLIKLLSQQTDKKTFLNILFSYKFDELKREKLETIIKLYYMNFLNFKEEQINEILKKKVKDEEIIYLINDIKNKINNFNVLKNFNIYDKNKINLINEVDKKAKSLKKIYIKYKAYKNFK